MFKAGKRLDYGIMLMASLPESSDQYFRSLQDIAEEKNLSAAFLSQVILPLKRFGLVKAKEGLKGGYQLSKPSTKITLSEIYSALEGPVKLTTCQNDEMKCLCEVQCPTKSLWKNLQQIMSNYLEHHTLSEFRP